MAFKMKGISSLIGSRTESIKKEKNNLLQDNPIASHASDGSKMYGEEGPKNMENVLAGNDQAQGPMMYGEEGPKAMKPDFIDIDNDGDTKESMKSAAKSKGPKKYGAMKGDQSKTRKDYSMDKGGTDKGYKGKSGSSKGDQSKTKGDFKKLGPKVKTKIKTEKLKNVTVSAKKNVNYSKKSSGGSIKVSYNPNKNTSTSTDSKNVKVTYKGKPNTTYTKTT